MRAIFIEVGGHLHERWNVDGQDSHRLVAGILEPMQCSGRHRYAISGNDRNITVREVQQPLACHDVGALEIGLMKMFDDDTSWIDFNERDARLRPRTLVFERSNADARQSRMRLPFDCPRAIDVRLFHQDPA